MLRRRLGVWLLCRDLDALERDAVAQSQRSPLRIAARPRVSRNTGLDNIALERCNAELFMENERLRDDVKTSTVRAIIYGFAVDAIANRQQAAFECASADPVVIARTAQALARSREPAV